MIFMSKVKKNNVNENESKKNNYLRMWKKKWLIHQSSFDASFIPIFTNAYIEADEKCGSNRTKNIRMKIIYLLIAPLFLLALIILYILYRRKIESARFIIIDVALVFIAFVIIIYIVSKWMDIKKYQETWARHYFHHHLLNHEIIQYVYELGDYSNKNDFDSKYIFINKFLAIENLNMEKFVANLENKEIRIGDWPELLRRIIK